MKNVLSILLLFGLTASVYAQHTAHSDKLITVAAFGKSMAIGVSVTSDNRVFVAFPDYNGNGNLALTEEKDGKIFPYPDKAWNTKGDYAAHFLHVQDLFTDADDNLWVLDSSPASAGNIFGDSKNVKEGKFKLVKINTRTNKAEKVYLFDGLDKTKSALNDVQIDLAKNLAYLSDPGQAAIVVLNLNTGKCRTLLQHTAYTLADNIVLQYGGVEMKNKNGKPFSSNINSIALTRDCKYFYFKPINKEDLFRIETKYLADTSLAEKDLENKVQDVGKAGITHGLIADAKGNIYLTTSEDYSITYLAPDGSMHTLVKDSRLLWPDSLGIGGDGYLYFSCSQMQRLQQWNNGVDKTDYPYRVYKVRLP